MQDTDFEPRPAPVKLHRRSHWALATVLLFSIAPLLLFLAQLSIPLILALNLLAIRRLAPRSASPGPDRGSAAPDSRARSAPSWPRIILFSVEMFLLQVLVVCSLGMSLLLAANLPSEAPHLLASFGFSGAVALALRRRLSGLERARALVVSPRLAVAALATVAALALLDRVRPFPFLVFHASCVFVSLLAASAYFGSLGDTARGELSLSRQAQLLATILFLFASLLTFANHYSALGRYGVDRASGCSLEPSRRSEIDSLGFRGPEVGIIAEPGTLRIVAMGDSATFGMFLSESESFSRILESRLNAGPSGSRTRTEVINAGVPGSTINSILARFENKVLPLKPQIVILAAGGNDGALLRRNLFADSLREFLDQASQGGILVVVCSYPKEPDADLSRINAILKEAAESRRLPFVDLAAIFRKDGRDGVPVALWDGHPSRHGNELIAEDLEAVLLPLIDSLAPSSPTKKD